MVLNSRPVAPSSLRNAPAEALLDGGRLLRAHRAEVPWPAGGLPSLVAAAAAQREPWTAWSDPAEGRELVAGGILLRREFAGSQRFSRAAEVCSALFEQLEELGDAPRGLPCAWAGFAFGEGGPTRTGAWSGWAPGHLRVPRWLLYRDRAGCGLILHGWAGSRREVARTREALREALEGWEPLTRPVGQRPGRLRRVGGASRDAWLARVTQARAAIAAGELNKVVLARACRLRAEAGAFVPGASLAHLRRAHPTATLFGVSPGTLAPGQPAPAFLGASPEPLLRVEGSTVTTVALAGTAPAGAAQTLAICPKNAAEHALVVAGIRRALGPRCRRLFAPSRPHLRRAGPAVHLETPFAGTLLPGSRALDLVAGLHPTPALGGQPRGAALDWLARHEGLDRGWFGAPFGWLSPGGDAAFRVTIRSALLRGTEAWAFAGAGIVADSDPAAEWDETELKLRSALGALGGSEEGSA